MNKLLAVLTASFFALGVAHAADPAKPAASAAKTEKKADAKAEKKPAPKKEEAKK